MRSSLLRFVWFTICTLLIVSRVPGGERDSRTSQKTHSTSGVLYASPTGRPQGQGTRTDPLTLNSGLWRMSPDTVLELVGGVYRVPTNSIMYIGGRGGGKNIIRAAAGERPIITEQNGYPPYVVVRNQTRVEGIWFGGTVDTANTPFNMSNDDEIVGCVFWGYYGCIGDASKHNLYENNLFVNCGREPYNHAMYISGLSVSWDSCTTVRRNIFIGGEGYAIHLWHGPTYIKVEHNFVAHVNHCIASDGTEVIARDNIFWSNTLQPMMLLRGKAELTHNLIGKNHTYYGYCDPAAESVVVDLNEFINPASPGGPFGTHSASWDETLAPSRVGTSAIRVNNAIDSIETSFSNPDDAILTDSTILRNVTTLLRAVDTWNPSSSKKGVIENPPGIPTGFELFQNFPNPFNPSTTIKFFLIRGGYTILTVYSLLGALVKTLVSETLAQGMHSVVWDASDLPSGVYFYTLHSGSDAATRRLHLIK